MNWPSCERRTPAWATVIVGSTTPCRWPPDSQSPSSARAPVATVPDLDTPGADGWTGSIGGAGSAGGGQLSGSAGGVQLSGSAGAAQLSGSAGAAQLSGSAGTGGTAATGSGRTGSG